MRRRWIAAAAIVIAVAAGVWLVRGARGPGAGAVVTTQPAERHDIALTIEASGTIEPRSLVEVKSKASGTITEMPVSAGSRVNAGDLLVQIDTRDVQNQYDQSLAARRASKVKVEVSGAQKARSDSLFAQGVITADEHEGALLDFANADAAEVTARTNLELAKQRLDDATVRAPVAGTVLSQLVTPGQVISSATSSVSGGTALLTMADLSRIRMRALVAEADVGNVRAGQRATVTVDAFPNRAFEGTVEKVEPLAVVAQSVTNFPVLVSLENEDGALLPGMNGEVSLVVERRSDVLAVPVDAVRSLREALVLAPSLGLDADSVRAGLERQRPARFAGAGRMDARGADGGGDGTRAADDRAGRRGADGAREAGAAWRSEVPRDSLRARGERSGVPRDSLRARGARRGAGRRGEGRGDAAGAQGSGARAAGAGWSGAGEAASGAPMRAQVVFVKGAGGIEPRLVRLGLSDFDWSEVISGIAEGEEVVLLGVAQAQSDRDQRQAEVRRRVGTMPGGIGGARGAGRGR